MSILISDIFDEILEHISESGTGSITYANLLKYYNEARRRLNIKVKVIYGESLVKASTGKLFYDLPYDYKSNLRRVEFDSIPLQLANEATLDDYDKQWRDSSERTVPDDTPIYYLVDLTGYKFAAYPPPTSDGNYATVNDYGVPETATVGNESVVFAGPGVPEELEVGGEIIDHYTEYGVVESLISQQSNFRLLYDKKFIKITATNNVTVDNQTVDIEFEPYIDTIMDWIYFKIFSTDRKRDTQAAENHFQLYTDGYNDIKATKQNDRPPMSLGTVHRKPGYNWNRRRRGNS